MRGDDEKEKSLQKEKKETMKRGRREGKDRCKKEKYRWRGRKK